MSSDDLYRSIEISAWKQIVDVRAGAGFRYTAPLAECVGDTASFVAAQYRHGGGSPEATRSAPAHLARLAARRPARSCEAGA
jgi:hypothetical protein